MGYQELFLESNQEALERYELVMERIKKIPAERTVKEKYQDYFTKMAEFIVLADTVMGQKERGELESRSKEACEETNRRLFEDLFPENYEGSYGNPKAAVSLLGEKFAPALCFLYAELRAMIGYAFEGRKMNMVLLCELFVEIYNCFESEEEPEEKEISNIIYWFFHDYSEIFAEDKVRDMVEPSYDFFTRIILDSDLTDGRYLYLYGEYIGENELGLFQYLNTLTEEEVQSMADTMTEGFRIGYAHIGKDLNAKDTVCLEYPIGFERVMRKAIANFEKLGLKSTVYRNPVSSFARGLRGQRGCYGISVNRQYDFDHKADKRFYLDKAYVERQLESMKAAYEKYKKQAKGHAGPAVTEIFGEVPFEPEI
ncbi:MAG: leucyl aminopeptidase, partial [Lachnospiraceae bacterium]|nr:leucyl aminopeptidase [Lachnospiraceae bacterium]